MASGLPYGVGRDLARGGGFAITPAGPANSVERPGCGAETDSRAAANSLLNFLAGDDGGPSFTRNIPLSSNHRFAPIL